MVSVAMNRAALIAGSTMTSLAVSVVVTSGPLTVTKSIAAASVLLLIMGYRHEPLSNV
jgi:hypothetical protein